MFEEGITVPHPDSRTQGYCGLCIVLQSQTVSPSFHTAQHTQCHKECVFLFDVQSK